MIETARRFLEQKLGSVGFWIAIGALAILGAPSLASGQTSGFTTTLAMFVIASGIIARDASSGAIQMILSRPILRAEYVLGRFFGAVGMLAGFLGTTLLLAFLLDRAAALAGWSSGAPAFDVREALRLTGQDFFGGILVAAILLFFSTFLRGMGDVLSFLLFGLIFGLLPQIGNTLHMPILGRLGHWLTTNLAPDGAWGEILHGGRFLRVAIGQYVLALAGYLLLAVLIFNRREFSYGTD